MFFVAVWNCWSSSNNSCFCYYICLFLVVRGSQTNLIQNRTFWFPLWQAMEKTGVARIIWQRRMPFVMKYQISNKQILNEVLEWCISLCFTSPLQYFLKWSVKFFFLTKAFHQTHVHRQISSSRFLYTNAKRLARPFKWSITKPLLPIEFWSAKGVVPQIKSSDGEIFLITMK